MVIASGPVTTEIRRAGEAGGDRYRRRRIRWNYLQREIDGHRPVKLPGMPRFTGGAVGYIGYEYITRIEPSVPAAPLDALGIPLTYFMLSDTLLIFDRVSQTLRLCVNAHLPSDSGPGVDRAYGAAVDELQSLYEVAAPDARARPGAARRDAGRGRGRLRAISRGAAYEKLVEDVKEYIRGGRHHPGRPLAAVRARRSAKTPLDLYRALRTVNPSPYMFILDAGDFALVGASPEVHVRLTDGLVEIRPIAGTRTRRRHARPRTSHWRRNSWPTPRSAPST